MRHIHVLMVMLLLFIGMVGIATAELPEGVHAKITHAGGGPSMSITAPSYWSVLVDDQWNPSDGDITDGSYLGWCVDSLHTISNGSYNFKIYSSLYPVKMEENDYLKTIPDGNWKKINYILNNKAIAHDNARAIQAAIWIFDGGIAAGYGSWYTGSDYTDLVAAANSAEGESFTPSGDQVYAVVIVPLNSNGVWNGGQICLIEVENPPEIVVPEFPAMFLPLGMLIGMIFVVSMLRRKD